MKDKRAKGFINTPIPYKAPVYYDAIWDHARDAWNVTKFLSDGTEQVLETFAFKEDADDYITNEKAR